MSVSKPILTLLVYGFEFIELTPDPVTNEKIYRFTPTGGTSQEINYSTGTSSVGQDYLTTFDVKLGDWIADIYSGQSLEITHISSPDPVTGALTFTAKDTGRYEELNLVPSLNIIPFSKPSNQNFCIIFSLDTATKAPLINLQQANDIFGISPYFISNLNSKFKYKYPSSSSSKTTFNILTTRQIYINSSGLTNYELGTFVFPESLTGRFYGMVDILEPSTVRFNMVIKSNSATLENFTFGNDPETKNNNKILEISNLSKTASANTVYTVSLSNATLPIPQGLISTISLYFIQE
jgi:hypothetical protein